MNWLRTWLKRWVCDDCDRAESSELEAARSKIATLQADVNAVESERDGYRAGLHGAIKERDQARSSLDHSQRTLAQYQEIFATLEADFTALREAVGDTPEEALIYALNLGDGSPALYFRLQMLIDDYFKDDDVVVEPADMEKFREWLADVLPRIAANHGSSKQMIDATYQCFRSRVDLERAVAALWLQYFQWKEDITDCDWFALEFMVMMARIYRANLCPYTESEWRNPDKTGAAHAFSAPWTNQDGAQVAEPQAGWVRSYHDPDMGDWYTPEKWRFIFY